MATGGVGDGSGDAVYKMQRGLCKIINNERFNCGEIRLGSEKDKAALEDTFTYLGFKVESHDNCSARQMKEILTAVAKDPALQHYDCFVCCILSHGNERGVAGVDGYMVGIEDLRLLFMPDRCRALLGKPKLFFVQACKGSAYQKEYEIDSEKIPGDCDFLMGFATVPGYVSFRDEKNGSSYIQALARLLKQYAGREDLHHIHLRVNNEVTKTGQQAPEFSTSLRKKLFLHHVPQSSIRVVIIGKSGNGKSSLANTLCGQEYFKARRQFKTETSECRKIRVQRGVDTLEIIDTPGMCDPHDEIREARNGLTLASPGPHIFLMALRCDSRFTREEYEAYTKIKELFSEEMKRYLIVVFNGMDMLEDYDDTSSIAEQRADLQKEIFHFLCNEEHFPKVGRTFQTVLSDASQRYIGMNNKADPATRSQQADDLVALIKRTVAQNGGTGHFYSSRR